MNNREVNIVLRAINKMAPGVKGAITELNKMRSAAARAAADIAKAFRETLNSIKTFGREIQRMGRDLAFLGAAITAPFAIAVKNMEKYSLAVQNQTGRISDAFLQIQKTIAEAALPVIKQFADVLGRLANMFNAMDPQLRSQIVQWTLIGGALLAVSGTVLILLGHIIKLTAAIGAMLAGASPVAAVLIGIAGAVAAISYAWANHHDIFMKAIGAIETVGFTVFAVLVGWISVMLKGLQALIGAWGKFLQVSGKATRNSQLVKWGDDAVVAANNVGKLVKQMDAMKKAAMTNATNAAGGSGSLSTALDQMIKNSVAGVQKLKDAFNSMSPMVSHFGEDLGIKLKNAAQSFSDGMVDAFDQALFEGKSFTESMKQLLSQVSRDFLKDVIKSQLQNSLTTSVQNGTGGIGSILGLFTRGMAPSVGGAAPPGGVGTASGASNTNALANAQGVATAATQASTALKGLTSSSTTATAASTKMAAASTQAASGASVAGSAMSMMGPLMWAFAAGALGVSAGQAIGGKNGLAGQQGRFGMPGAIVGGAIGFAVGGPVGAVVGAGLGGFAGGLFHYGGKIQGNVRRADQGLSPRPNDRMIMAQTGEGVISRQGMIAIGGEQGLNQVNSGRSMDSGTGGDMWNVNIFAVDSKSFADQLQKNPDAILRIVQAGIRKNATIRKDIKEFAR